MRIKILSLFLAAMMLLGLLTGCAAAETAAIPVHVEGAVFGGQNGDSIPAVLRFDPAWLTQGDNTVYHRELAEFSALLSADVYYRKKDLDKGTQNRVLIDGANAEDYDWTALLKALGFTDASYIESFRVREYDGDGNDSVTLLMGYLPFEGCDVYAISLRGCFSAQEWLSVFDVGASVEEYVSYTGAHAEWTHPEYAKGVDIGANRAMEFIVDFMDAHDVPENPDCVLVAGHSRGGMLASIIGAALEKNTDAKAFTYAFSAMPVTTDPEAQEYRTIFNLFDSGDFYTDMLSFSQGYFTRCGRDIPLNVTDSEEIRAAIAQLKGRDDYRSLGEEGMEKYRALFGGRFVDRSSLYEAHTVTETFEKQEDAQARLDALRGAIGAEAGLALETFCSVDDMTVNEDGGFSVTLHYCDGALLWGYGKILSYGGIAYDAFVSLFADDTEGCHIADFLLAHADEITNGHLLANSYVMTRFVTIP